MALPEEIRSKSSLVAYWRLGARDVWRHGGIADAIPANVSRSAGRHFATAKGALSIGGGPALCPTDALADSTSFTGVAADRLAVDHNSALSCLGDFTFLAVVKPTSFADNRMILSKTGGATGIAPYWWYLAITSGLPVLQLGDGATNTGFGATAAVPAGVVSMIAVTLSGTTGAHYLNGATNGSASFGAQARADLGSLLGIGGLVGTSNPVLGPMAELAMFNAALSASELLAFAVLGGFA